MNETLRLLVVEDDEVDRLVLQRALRTRSTEFEVVETTSLKEAAEALVSHAFDCAVVDLHLPDGSGLDLLDRLGDVPAIILTGLDDVTVSRDALSRGAQDYVTKDELNERNLWRAIRYAVERRNAEQLRTTLQHTDRLASLGRIGASVAHEINNPNAFIAANLQLLKRDTDRWVSLLDALATRADIDASLAHILREHHATELVRDVADLVDDCLEGIGRVTGLVRQMQTFSRQSPDESPSAVHINAVIEQTLSLLRTNSDPDVVFETMLGDDLPVLHARHNQFVQIVTNLVENARQATASTPGKGHIRVSTERVSHPSPGVRLLVDDNGGGIPDALRGKVLDPFFTTKAVGEGTGLGLSIVREIVEQHLGTLVLLDSPLGGARIRIDFVVDTGMTLATVKEKSEPAAMFQLTKECRILVVDDEPSVLRAMRRLLIPHSVICATGPEASLLLETDTFDAVICDLMMPDVDGVSLFEVVEARNPDLAKRFIFHTGGAVSLRADALLARVRNPVLEKPAEHLDILRAVDAVVGT